MSGGHFDYDQYKLGNIADTIQEIIHNNDSEEINEWGDTLGRGYSAETILEFRDAISHLRLAQIYAHEIDWLLSGDTGEERFHVRLNKDIKSLTQQILSGDINEL